MDVILIWREIIILCFDMAIQRKCIVCGNVFTITDKDAEYFKSKGWDLPKRCISCRKSNRELNLKRDEQDLLFSNLYLDNLFVEKSEMKRIERLMTKYCHNDRPLNHPVNNLIIVGNGFDLWQGLKTSYSHFESFYEANKINIMWDMGIEPIMLMENEEPKEYRSHFDLLYFDLNVNEPCTDVEVNESISEESNDFWNSFEDNLQFLDDITINLYFGKELDDLNDISECCENAYAEIRRCFVDWIKSISIKKCNSKYNFGNALFINFNYTDTLQKRFSVDNNQIIHIHGRAADEQSIVFGHGNRVDDPCDIDLDMSPLFSGRSLGAYIIEGIKYRFCKHPSIQWNCLTKRLESKKTQLHDVKNVYILGHSLSKVDMYYFKKIKMLVSKDAFWHIAYYSQNDKRRTEAFAQSIELLRYKLYPTIDEAILPFSLS